MTHKAYSYIRFSTPEQAKGTSQARQLAATSAYCAKHGLTLDDSLTFRDLGVSGFSGKNAKEGALAVFLKAVETGRVKRGSYLIIESLDRLSRQEPMIAFGLFQQIIVKGIAIVTLMDGQTMTQASLKENQGQIFIALGSMTRAHEESATKSKRLRTAWAIKRKGGGERKLTSICPAWLSLSADKKAFHTHTTRVAIVNRIFRMRLEGKGRSSIARILNEERIPTFGKSDGWQPSYIDKILRNPAVIGTFQPHKMVTNDKTGKRDRVPDGEPLPGYFPVVVPAKSFLKVQSQWQAIPKGRKSPSRSNLFTGIARCSCGAPMHHVNKGASSKGGKYLVCSRAMRKLGTCRYFGWRYREVEAFVLMAIHHDLSLSDLQPEQSSALGDQLAVVEEEMAQATLNLGAAKKAVESLLDMIEQGETTGLRQRLDKREAEVKEHQKAVETLGIRETELSDRLSNSKQDIADAGAALDNWVTKFHASKGPAGVDLRSRMAALIRRWVASVVFASGNGKTRTITIEMGNGLSHALMIAVDTGDWTGAATKVVKVGTKTEKLPLYDQMFVSAKGMGGVTSAMSLRHLYYR
jgi:DNA invertase Pin-like site-specific DNA recombinase